MKTFSPQTVKRNFNAFNLRSGNRKFFQKPAKKSSKKK